MITEIKTAIEIISAIPTLKELIPDNSKKKQQKDIRMTVLRSYLAEVQHNDEILKTVTSQTKQEDAFNKIRAVAPLLENAMGAFILYGSHNGELKDIQELSKIQLEQEKLKVQESDEQKDDDVFESAKTLEQAVYFCTLRIDILKSLAKITEEQQQFFKNINITTRLNNIKTYTNQIRKNLEMNLNFYSEDSYK